MVSARAALLVALVFPSICSAGTPAAQAPELAPPALAHTFAQVRDPGGRIATLLVVGLDPEQVRAIDLSAASGLYAADAFDVVAMFDAGQLDALARTGAPVRHQRHGELLGVGPRGLAHVAAGTNYPEHGKEVGMDQGTFLFPKLSPAGGPRATVTAAPGVLLDYEVEVCARFDREIRSLADFDASRIGLFLCGDYSDRAALFRNIDLRDPYSGDGFADAKSGADRFPAGPFLVVPRDWRAFLAATTLQTRVDGRLRQDVRAADMIRNLRDIVGEALAGAAEGRTWSYRHERIRALRRDAIPTSTAVLTGTGDGVVFREPRPELVAELLQAADRPAQRTIIDRYIGEEDARRIYLQPGNRVRYQSNYLGWIDTEVVAAGAGH
ncbi:fumarylacetoacetate hydrolase family protein [Pseudoxanthomonas sp.]|uniref:fumarylacetoacetate hydrolase family protein n=1 Tax=Pseudoxanthomonas sp. TaxID=1871049 RepID=UPI002585921F|nr:fumarylacetoacetate hydrolase family protein [Pseudoxanthomonas sp.]MCR6684907.1 fumarylacetoacetate hydrolase family protein [Pseudoxanthomonas sp.]